MYLELCQSRFQLLGTFPQCQEFLLTILDVDGLLWGVTRATLTAGFGIAGHRRCAVSLTSGDD